MSAPAAQAALDPTIAASQPLPIADALAALFAAASLHERRDRVVECFRAALRYVGAIALATRVQFGPGPRDEDPQLRELVRTLRARGLTDGQWVGLLRGLCGSWAGSEDAFAIPALARAFCGRDKGKLAKAIDGLLEMRKAETVAHGATGSADAIRKVLERREPQLAALLGLLEAVWQDGELCVPLATPEKTDEPQLAWRLVGYTPPRGRFARRELAAGVRVQPGEPVLVDAEGKPRLSLHPVALFRRASPEAVEELFLLDGAKKHAALYVAFPSMAEHRESETWGVLGKSLLGGKDAEETPESAGGASRPYRGLMSFGPEHATLFFGREQQTEALANRIRRHPMVTVTGPSGSGKSSLLHAGVLPLLDMTVVSLRPGAEPIAALGRRLTTLFEGWEAAPDVAEVLAERPETLGVYLERFARAKEQTLCLCVDQAEEVFTLCHDEAQREAFGEALASVGLDADGPLRVVLSLREDFFARLSTIAPLRGLYSRQVEVVTTPERADLVRVLFAPAQLFGFAFEDEPLVDTMVTAVHGEPAALAMLQFCADQLWERRDRTWKRLTWDAYRAIGGVEGALATHAESILDAMTTSQQAAVRAMLLRLVTEEGTRAVVPRADLCADESGVAVLDRLVEARLLTTREGEGGDVVEIVHEALLRHWERLRRWLEEDEGFVRIRARIATAAARWHKEGRAADLLLGEGKPLLEADELASARRDALVPVELAFIEASQARGRRARRLKRAAVTGLALLTVVAAGVGVVAWQQRGQAQHMAGVAAESEADATKRAISLLAEEGRRELTELRPLRALPHLAEAYSRGGSDPALLAMVADAARPLDALRFSVHAHDSPSQMVAFTGDGSRIVTGSWNGDLAAFDANDGTLAWRVRAHASGTVRSLAIREDGMMATAGDDRTVAVIDPNGKLVRSLTAHEAPVNAVSFQPGGTLLASAAEDGTVRLWDLEKEVAVLRGHDAHVSELAFSHDGKLLASGSQRSVRVWRMPGGEEAAVIDKDVMRVESLAFSGDGEHLFVAAGTQLTRWKVADGTLEGELHGHGGGIVSLATAPDGRSLVSTSYDNTARIWDTASGGLLATTGGHDGFAKTGGFTPSMMRRARWSQDGLTLVSTGSDATARIWDVATGHALAVLALHGDAVADAAFHPTNGDVAVVDGSGTLAVWSGRASRLLRSFGQPPGAQRPTDDDTVKQVALAPSGDGVGIVNGAGCSLWHGPARIALDGAGTNVRFVAFSGDGARVVAAAKDAVTLHDARDGKLVVRLEGSEHGASRVAIEPRGGLVAAAGPNESIDLWSADGKHLFTLDALPSGPIVHLAFSASGERLVSVGRLKTRVWDALTGQPLYQAEADEAASSLYPRAELSPDGDRVLLAQSGLQVKLVAVGRKHPICEIDAFDGSFSPDGARVLVFEDKSPTARIHDAADCAVLMTLDGHAEAEELGPGAGPVREGPKLTLDGHSGSLTSARWSPDGTRIVTGGSDGTARLWDAVSGRLLATIGAHHHVSDLVLGADLLLTLGEGTAKLWDVHREQRPPAAIAVLVEQLPWSLVDGRLVPKKRP